MSTPEIALANRANVFTEPQTLPLSTRSTISGRPTDPFYPHNLRIVTDGARHAGLTSAIFWREDGFRGWIVYRDGEQHGVAPSRIMKAETFDGGLSWSTPELVYQEAGVDVRDFAAIQGSAAGVPKRWMIIARRVQISPQVQLSPIRLDSANEGNTWGASIRADITQHWVGYTDFLRSPFVDHGYITYGYQYELLGAPNTALLWARTTNGGSNWTWGEVAVAPLGQTWAEPSVVRLGDTNRWIMVVRRQQAAGLTGYAFRSTDMVTWDGPFDTGQVLGQNPPKLMWDDGDVVWYAPQRLGSSLQDGLGRNTLLSQRANADAVWNDLTAWPGWQVVTRMPHRLIGYQHISSMNGVHYMTCCVNEWVDPADGIAKTAQVAIVSSLPSGGLNAGLIHTPQGDLKARRAGSGILVTTPDGSATYRIAVDNSGSLTTTLVP